MPSAINANVLVPSGYLITIVNGVGVQYSGANLPIGVSLAAPNQEIPGALPISIPSDSCWRIATAENIPINALVYAKADGTATVATTTGIQIGYARANSNSGFVLVWPTGSIEGSSPADLGLGIVTLEAVSRALVAADNCHTLVCSSSPAFTVNAGMPNGFGCAFKGTCTFVSGTATVTDARTAGVLYPWCALIQTNVAGTTYDVVGATT